MEYKGRSERLNNSWISGCHSVMSSRMLTVILLSLIGSISSYRISEQNNLARSKFLEQETLDSDLILPSAVQPSLALPGPPQPTNLQPLAPQPLAQFYFPQTIKFQTGFNVQPIRRPLNDDVSGISTQPPVIQSLSQADVSLQILKGPQNLCGHASVLIHAAHRGLGFHFSWCRAQRIFTWDEANDYCRNLGRDFQPVCIEDGEKNDFITDIIAKHSVQFIWTGGNKRGSNIWRWVSGSPMVYTKWSYTGGEGHPQPDNREGNEECLGILKNVYNDGIVWHDIACHHVKPVICETVM